jgi:hypothetical protein
MYPKYEVLANAKYRLEVGLACAKSRGLQWSWKEWCKDDILLWVNTFCATYDPRGENKVVPFVTYPFQDAAILAIQEQVNKGEDVLIEKSRDMGATWMCLLVYLHFAQFRPNFAFGLSSRTEDFVDRTNFPKCLFWKLDFLLENQPDWMVCKGEDYSRIHMGLSMTKTRSTITGAATTEDMFRGDRLTSILADEFDALEIAIGHQAVGAMTNATNCKIFNSTYKSLVGAFASQARRKDIRKIVLPWTDHPEKVEGLYHEPGGKAKSWYKDAHLGKPRSPWYDRKCEELVIPSLIARELDIDPYGANSPFFPEELVNQLMERDTREPFERGRLSYVDEKPQWLQDARGEFLLWLHLQDGRPPWGKYVIGSDLSEGTGATPSVLSIADIQTGEKVGEFATANMGTHEFADVAVAACKWFWNAHFCWEMNGPGVPFGKRVVDDLKWTNVYYRTNEQSVSKKQSDTPGWYSTRDNKEMVLTRYATALSAGKFKNRSVEAVRELQNYAYGTTGRPENTRVKAATDMSSAGESHGDRVIADALCCFRLMEFATVEVVATNPEDSPPWGSLAWWRKQEAMEKREAALW